VRVTELLITPVEIVEIVDNELVVW